MSEPDTQTRTPKQGQYGDTYNLLYVFSNNVLIRPTFTNFNGQIGIDRKNIIPVLEKLGNLKKKWLNLRAKSGN